MLGSDAQFRILQVAGTAGLVLAILSTCTVSPAQLPDECKPQGVSEEAFRDSPTKVYGSAGARFADQGNLKCALALFEEVVRLEPYSAQAHYNLGVAHERAKQLPEAAAEFRLALQYKTAMTAAHTSLGSVLLRLGKPAEAEDEFREALRLDPNSVVALGQVAQRLAAERRYAPAIRYWKRALTIEPDWPETTLALAVATNQNGDPKASIRILGELVKAHPEMAAAHFALGSVYAQESRFREAADEFSETIRIDATDDDAWLARGRALLRGSAFQDALPPAQEYVRRKPADPEGHLLLGSVENGLTQYSAAIMELEHAAVSLPENAEVQYELAVALAHSQNPKAAVPHFDKAIARKPSDWRAQAELAAVLREAGELGRARDAASRAELLKAQESKIKRLPEKDRQAADLLHGGHADKAAELYHEMLVVDPGNARTEHNLARALAAAHDPKGERLQLERAVRHDPALAVALGDLGRLDLAEGKSEAAEKHLEAALAADPQLVSAVGDLGVLRANKGDTEGAEKLFREAVEDDPSYEQGHLNLGLTLAKQQKFREAEAEVDEAVRLAPDDLSAMAAAGRVRARLGKSAESVELLREVVARAPQSATAHLDLGMVLAESYDLAGALVEYTNAVRLAPGSPLAHLNRGRVLFDLGRNEEARPDLETARRLAPDMAEPYYFLAMIEKQHDHYKRAVALLQNLVKLQPRKATSWYLLGQCLAYDSQKLEAIAAWRQAIAIDPDYTQALWNLAQALSPTDPDEAARLTTRYSEVQKKRLIVDQAGTLGNDALAAGAAHDWPEALRQFQKAIEVCGECAIKADLHKKLGLTDCEMGDIDKGEKELRLAQALKPNDPDIEQALGRIAAARNKQSASPSKSEKVH